MQNKIHKRFCLSYVEPLGYNLGEYRAALRFAFKLKQSPCVPFTESGALYPFLFLRAEAEQPQLVGDRGLSFAELFSRLFLSESEPPYQPGNPASLLKYAKVGSLEIFKESLYGRLFIGTFDDDAGYLLQTR